jgi:hypothetical protein
MTVAPASWIVEAAAGMPQTVFATFTLQRCAIRTRTVNVLNG